MTIVYNYFGYARVDMCLVEIKPFAIQMTYLSKNHGFKAFVSKRSVRHYYRFSLWQIESFKGVEPVLHMTALMGIQGPQIRHQQNQR